MVNRFLLFLLLTLSFKFSFAQDSYVDTTFYSDLQVDNEGLWKYEKYKLKVHYELVHGITGYMQIYSSVSNKLIYNYYISYLREENIDGGGKSLWFVILGHDSRITNLLSIHFYRTPFIKSDKEYPLAYQLSIYDYKDQAPKDFRFLCRSN